MLDKELAGQLTDDEKQDIKYRYFELLPKVLAHPEIVYAGNIEGTSQELINTIARTVISLKSEGQEKTNDIVANIIVDSVPEDELIKIIKEAVDENEKKKANLNKSSRYEEGNKYTL